MYEPVSAFDHDAHVRALHGNAGCVECHENAHGPKDYATATACADCHQAPAVVRPVIEAPEARWRSAPGYEEAMHELCIACHRREVAEHPQQYPVAMTRCAWCHDVDRAGELLRLRPHLPEAGQVASRAP